MTSTLGSGYWLAVLMAAAILPTSALVVQDATPAVATAPHEVRLNEAERDQFDKLLAAYFKSSDVENRSAIEAAAREFAVAHARPNSAEDEVQVTGSILKDLDYWHDVSMRRYASSLGKQTAGRIQEEVVSVEVSGETYVFEYSYRLPKNYDPKVSWPTIVCIPDRNSNGKEYLKKIWEDPKENKDIIERFILIAPTVGEKTLSKGAGVRKPAVERLDWFNKFHQIAILNPIRLVAAACNVDATRIYLEGVGEGADAACYLACTAGDVFAAAAVRSGWPRVPEVGSGLDRTPVLFVHREGSDFTTAGRKAAFDKLVALTKDRGMDESTVQFSLKPALEKVNKNLFGGQDTDPVIESTAEIAAFLEKHQLVAYPESLRLTFDSTGFSRRAWLNVRSFDTSVVNEIAAKIDRASNTIEITAPTAYEFTLYLNDKLVDLDRVVNVVINGKLAASETVERQLQLALRHIKSSQHATHRVWTASMSVQAKEEEPTPPGGNEGGKSGEGENGK